MQAAGELIQDHRTLVLCNEQVTGRISSIKYLHIAGSTRVTDIHRIEQHTRCNVVFSHFVTEPLKAIAPHHRHINTGVHIIDLKQQPISISLRVAVPVQFHTDTTRKPI